MVKKPARAKKEAKHSTNLFFEDNRLLPILYGREEEHLKRLEKLLHIELVTRGNMLSITGATRDVAVTEQILMDLYGQVSYGEMIDMRDVEAAVRMAPPVMEATTTPNLSGTPLKKRKPEGEVAIKTLKKPIHAYSHMQANYMRELFDSDLVFAVGPAGTGKTYIAVAMAVYMYLNQKVERIVLSRPAVEAGEKLGFLPGGLKDKIDPYLRPLYDALFDMMPAEKVHLMTESGEIEVAPLAFMRGRTLANAFVILDEAQNTTPTQMKMFLTRMGENSRFVITGDLSQTDLPKDIKSGLRDCLPKVEPIEGISVIRFSEEDVVRHPLAARIVHAYDEWEKRKKEIKPEDYYR